LPVSLFAIYYIFIMFRAGQNHTYIRIYDIRCKHGIFSREITLHMVICSVHIRFWPTLITFYSKQRLSANPNYILFKTEAVRRWRHACRSCPYLFRYLTLSVRYLQPCGTTPSNNPLPPFFPPSYTHLSESLWYLTCESCLHLSR